MKIHEVNRHREIYNPGFLAFEITSLAQVDGRKVCADDRLFLAYPNGEVLHISLVTPPAGPDEEVSDQEIRMHKTHEVLLFDGKSFVTPFEAYRKFLDQVLVDLGGTLDKFSHAEACDLIRRQAESRSVVSNPAVHRIPAGIADTVYI